MPGRDRTVGVTAQDNRLFVNAIIWIFKTGAFDLPERFGHWNSINKRFARWSRLGVFDRICRILSKDADVEFLLMDGRIVKTHQHASGDQKRIETRRSAAHKAD